MLPLSVVVVSLVVALGSAQEEPGCASGTCCNEFCVKRDDPIIPDLRWDCEIHTALLSDCANRFPQCSGGYPWESEPVSCSIGNGNGCQAMAQCCWTNFWANTELTDKKPDESGLRNTWGDYFCRQAKRDASVPGTYWKLDFQGRCQHCGRLDPTWYRLNNDIPTPKLCCNSLAQFDPTCSEEEPTVA